MLMLFFVSMQVASIVEIYFATNNHAYWHVVATVKNTLAILYYITFVNW